LFLSPVCSSNGVYTSLASVSDTSLYFDDYSTIAKAFMNKHYDNSKAGFGESGLLSKSQIGIQDDINTPYNTI